MTEFKRIDAEIGGAGHLSCSQLGGIFGVSHYATPYTVALAYLGKEQDEPSDESQESMAMGHAFEDTIARFYADKLGVHIRKANLAYCRKDMPWFVCHPDRLVDERVEGKKIAFEVKFVSPFARSEWGEEGTDQIPDSYLLQCQGYFFCGVPANEVWVIRMMGNRIRKFVVKPDKELQEAIREKVTALHDLLESGKLPEPSNPVEFASAHPTDNGKAILADTSIDAVVRERGRLADQEKALKTRLDELDMQVRNFIGDNAVLLGGDGQTRVATLKVQSSSRFDSKRFKTDYPGMYDRYLNKSESRVLRYSK